MGILSLHALSFSKDFIMNPFLDFQKRSTCQPQTIEPNSLSFTGTLTWWKATGLTEQQLCSLIPLVNPCFVWHLKRGAPSWNWGFIFCSAELSTQLRHTLPVTVRLHHLTNPYFKRLTPSLVKSDCTRVVKFEKNPRLRCTLLIFLVFNGELAPKFKSLLRG